MTVKRQLHLEVANTTEVTIWNMAYGLRRLPGFITLSDEDVEPQILLVR